MTVKAATTEAGCRTLLTDDLKPGRRIESLTIVGPAHGQAMIPQAWGHARGSRGETPMAKASFMAPMRPPKEVEDGVDRVCDGERPPGSIAACRPEFR